MDRTVQVAIDKLQALQQSVHAGKHVVTGDIRFTFCVEQVINLLACI